MKIVFSVIAAALIAVNSAGAGLASDVVDKILADAENECKSFENGVLLYDRDVAISRIDVTGDGTIDEIVDSSAFQCSTAASLFCGTGGCGLSVIAAGVTFDFLAKAWSVRAGENNPVLAIEVHWSECDYNSYCFEKFSWNGASFDSLSVDVEDPNVIMGLYDGAWVLQDYGDGKVTIEFVDDGNFSGQAPCNRYRGGLELTFPDIKFGPIAATRMLCANDGEEIAYFDHLAKVSKIRLSQSQLLLIQDDGTALTFRR